MDDLTALAAVLGPPDGAAAVTRTPRWSALTAPAPAQSAGAAPAVALRGRPALARGASPARLAGWAASREAALAAVRLRPPAPYAAATVHRIRTAPLRPGLLPRLRAALAGGALVRLQARAVCPPSGRTRLDEVLDAAHVTPAGSPRVGSGGGVLLCGLVVRAPTAADAPPRTGRPVVVRVRPDPAAPPGQAVAPAGEPCAPQVLAAGSTCGLAWVVEQRLPGRVPARLSAPLVADVVAFVTRLAGRRPGPVGTDVRQPFLDDLASIAAQVPNLAGGLAALGERVAGALAELPAVPVHGDLWRGNLLAFGGRLTGVVDWDAARPAGPAGADLLHLVATEERLAARRGIGAQLLRRPWACAAFTAPTAGYWRALEVRPSPAALDALGVAWWAGQVAATLRRTPELAGDRVWPQREIATVVRRLVLVGEEVR